MTSWQGFGARRANSDTLTATRPRLLMLTGQRLNEIAGARWSEINLDEPATDHQRQSHEEWRGAPGAIGRTRVGNSPRHTAFHRRLLSTPYRSGALPIHMGSKFKKKLDALSGVTGWALHAS